MKSASLPACRAGIRKMFGEDLSPSQVVERILKDIRQRGDDQALMEWTEKLDGKAPRITLCFGSRNAGSPG